MAQGGVSGILDYTAGGNVFGILAQMGFVGTQSGHEEGEGSTRRVYIAVNVSFEQKFKNVPDVTISNFAGESDTGISDTYLASVTKNGFVFNIEFEENGTEYSYSFDWTATGK